MAQPLLNLSSRTEVWVVALALATSLVLYWAMRGAPIGQAPRGETDEVEGPGAGYRDRVIAAMVSGLILIVAGAIIAVSRGVIWSLPAFALGFGLVLTLIAVNRRYRHSSPTLRRTVEFSGAALTAGLVAGILIVANVLAFRYGGRPLDFTRERTYSLSSQSLNLLKDLKRDVTFTVFFGASPQAIRQLERVQQLLELYQAANPRRVRIEYVNPFRDPERYDALKKRVPGVELTEGGGVVVEYGEGEAAERVVVRNSELFEIPRTGRGADLDRFVSAFKGEDAVTTALIRLREGRRARVAITTGHGEPSTTELDPRKPGIGLWITRLNATGSDVVPLNLIREEIPADTSLVLIVGPNVPFKPEEVARLKAFADRGGPVLVIVGGPEATGLGDFLRSYNVEIGPGVVVDPFLNYGRRPNLVFAPVLGQIHHPIVDPLINRAVLVPGASPINIVQPGPGKPVNMTLVPTAILRTTKEAWAETDTAVRRPERDEKDAPGPLNVAVVVAERPEPGGGRPGKPRLVVFSSRFVGDNFFLEVEPTNLDVLMNSIHWLRGRSELGGIAPKTHTALTLVADPILRARLVLVPTVMAVLLIIGLGITTYVARRE
jgi:gliding motility-associatede transport system auxiliary component